MDGLLENYVKELKQKPTRKCNTHFLIGLLLSKYYLIYSVHYIQCPRAV